MSEYFRFNKLLTVQLIIHLKCEECLYFISLNDIALRNKFPLQMQSSMIRLD